MARPTSREHQPVPRVTFRYRENGEWKETDSDKLFKGSYWDSAIDQARQPPRQLARTSGSRDSADSSRLRKARKAGAHGGQPRQPVGERDHLLRHRAALCAVGVERGLVAAERLTKASARLMASRMPTFMPWPPAGLCTCAASPASSTRPAR